MNDRLSKLLRMWDLDDTDADIAYMIAQEHLASGANDSSILWFDRCLALNPAYHYAYYHRAKALEACERIDEAMATLRLGHESARRDNDAQAINEIGAYLDELEP